MKNFNNFLIEYKDLTLFPEIRVNEYETSIKYFIEEHKSKEIVDNDSDFQTTQEVLDYFTFEKTCEIAHIRENDIQYEIPQDVSIEIEIIEDYIKSEGEENLNFDDSDFKDLEDLLTQDYIDIYDFNDVLVSEYEFVDWYMESKYVDFSLFFDSFYYNELTQIISESENNQIPIYRSLYIYKDDDLHKKHSGVGVYWTYNKNNAEAYSGTKTKSKHEIILKAEVDIRNIDWEQTFFKSVYNLSDEEEIETRDYATVKMTGYVLVDAIDDYISINTYRYREDIKKISDKEDYDIRSDFEKETKGKYNIDLDVYIDILV